MLRKPFLSNFSNFDVWKGKRMLSPRNPAFAREEILNHFNAIPQLRFDPQAFSQVTYAEPRLIRPPELLPSKRSFPALHPGLAELFLCFETGTQKLEYGRTNKRTWEKYFRFFSDRLQREAPGGFKIQCFGGGRTEYVNEDRNVARNWFENQLVPWLISNPNSHSYVLGDPGAGKSTLLKYLINSSSEYLKDNRTVMSRFEFLKYRYRWCAELEFGDSNSAPQIRKKLSEYISFIILRDALWARSYVENSHGNRERAFDLPNLKKLVRDALKLLSPTDKDLKLIVTLLDDALKPDQIDFLALRSISHEFRVLISKQLLNGFSLILLMDGLDCITVEDSYHESERFQILDLIMKNRTNLTTFDFELGVRESALTPFMTVSINSSTLFVMRENTFYLHENGLRHEVSMVKSQLFRVGMIDPQVAIFNAYSRISEVWAERAGASEAERTEVAKLMVRSTLLALRFINRAVGTNQSREYILGLFCGNLRMLFQFMARLLRWLIEDAIRDGLLVLSSSTTVRDILTSMTGPVGLEVLRRKSYRIIEILLFSDIPWFENQILVEKRSSYSMRVIRRKDTPFRDNNHFSGVVDNAFNYHSLKYIRNNDSHGLLEKIRIIQILENEAKTSNQIEELLFSRIGYESENIDDSLTILTSSQFVSVAISGGEIYFVATTRGKIVVKYLIKNLAYIEHVFHRTLFPKVLVDSINDERRTGHIDMWTASSIRNAFIFLTYLKFVENNNANGRPVPMALRIFEETRSRVLHSVRRILSPADIGSKNDDASYERNDINREQASDHRDHVLRRALRMIEKTINDWDQSGCLASSKSRPRPASPGKA